MPWAPCFCSPSRLNHGGGWWLINDPPQDIKFLFGRESCFQLALSNVLYPLELVKTIGRCCSFQHLFVVKTSLVRSNMFEKPRSIARGRWCKISVGRNLSPSFGSGKTTMDQDLFAESSWDRDWRPGTDPSESHWGWSLITWLRMIEHLAWICYLRLLVSYFSTIVNQHLGNNVINLVFSSPNA